MSDLHSFESELNELREKGLARSFAPADPNILNLSSNDYLGLSTHPAVIEAAAEALRKFGTGGTSSRLLAGTMDAHLALESALAAFLGKEGALVFSSGYHANTGLIPALAGASDFIAFDRLSHASIIDGVRLSGATFAAFHHNDPNHLDDVLAKRRPGRRRAIVISEGIFSMDGDRSKVAEISAVARRHDALVYLDEAHSIGSIGPDGKGAAFEAGVADQIDVHVGTLSKALASQGGFVAAKKILIDLFTTKCRSFLFTTALAPASAAAAHAALGLLPSVEDRRRRVQEDAADIRRAVAELGFDTLTSDSQIVLVWAGSVDATRALSRHLLSKGFFVPSIRPPTVPAGEGRVRLSITFRDDRRWLNQLTRAFADHTERPRRSGERVVQAG
ncbi:MAG: 8-amino-7-oxononanoate synthase [Elusimicrobia bacterium]|nr:8-amino-7-oxononanoate synthase [Elusimicrobiota bacterium]